MAVTEVDVRRPFVAIGERTGLCRALDRVGPATPAELALRSGFPEGFVEDWLSGLGAEGLHPLSPLTTTLNYGVIAADGSVSSSVAATRRLFANGVVAVDGALWVLDSVAGLLVRLPA